MNGDGLQVRDILYVDDLVRAFLLAHEHMESVSGQAFNIGGGPTRTTSLVELVELIGHIDHREVALEFDAWREADQRYYVSNTHRFEQATGWTPRVSVREGVRALHSWLAATRSAGSRPASTQAPVPATTDRPAVSPTVA